MKTITKLISAVLIAVSALVLFAGVASAEGLGFGIQPCKAWQPCNDPIPEPDPEPDPDPVFPGAVGDFAIETPCWWFENCPPPEDPKPVFPGAVGDFAIETPCWWFENCPPVDPGPTEPTEPAEEPPAPVEPGVPAAEEPQVPAPTDPVAPAPQAPANPQAPAGQSSGNQATKPASNTGSSAQGGGAAVLGAVEFPDVSTTLVDQEEDGDVAEVDTDLIAEAGDGEAAQELALPADGSAKKSGLTSTDLAVGGLAVLILIGLAGRFAYIQGSKR